MPHLTPKGGSLNQPLGFQMQETREISAGFLKSHASCRARKSVGGKNYYFFQNQPQCSLGHTDQDVEEEASIMGGFYLSPFPSLPAHDGIYSSI